MVLETGEELNEITDTWVGVGEVVQSPLDAPE